MDKRQLKSIIANGGATLNRNGEAVNFDEGYQVSKKDCYKIPVERVNLICKKVNSLLTAVDRGEYVGLWIDGGMMYVDISINVRKREKAERIGRSLAQIAIYDWSTGDCITL